MFNNEKLKPTAVNVDTQPVVHVANIVTETNPINATTLNVSQLTTTISPLSKRRLVKNNITVDKVPTSLNRALALLKEHDMPPVFNKIFSIGSFITINPLNIALAIIALKDAGFSNEYNLEITSRMAWDVDPFGMARCFISLITIEELKQAPLNKIIGIILGSFKVDTWTLSCVFDNLKRMGLFNIKNVKSICKMDSDRLRFFFQKDINTLEKLKLTDQKYLDLIIEGTIPGYISYADIENGLNEHTRKLEASSALNVRIFSKSTKSYSVADDENHDPKATAHLEAS